MLVHVVGQVAGELPKALIAPLRRIGRGGGVVRLKRITPVYWSETVGVLSAAVVATPTVCKPRMAWRNRFITRVGPSLEKTQAAVLAALFWLYG